MLKYLIIFVLIPCFAICQNELPIKSLFDHYDYQTREKYFLELSDTQKVYWLNRYIKEVGIDTTTGNTMENVVSAIHFIDLNHDDFPDIVDESNNGVAPVLIYLSSKDTFRKIIDEAQATLKAIEFIGNKTKIVTRVLGMVDYFEGESTYMLENDSIHLENYRTCRGCTLAPQQYFKHPLSIRTIIPNCPIRENPRIAKGECMIDDGEKEYNIKDNILERFSKNTKGLAWGESHDTTGQKWWLVEFMSIEEPVYRANMIGWMKASDLEEL